MGYIKEPEGVDFEINGKPLSDKQKQTISAFIKTDKARLALLKTEEENSRTANQVTPKTVKQFVR